MFKLLPLRLVYIAFAIYILFSHMIRWRSILEIHLCNLVIAGSIFPKPSFSTVMKGLYHEDISCCFT